MTDTEWFACTDPERMLEFLFGKTSDRKLRLFAVACCRQEKFCLKDQLNRQTIDIVENYADGLVSQAQYAS